MLPVDRPQPWESLDENGRIAAWCDPDSIFAAGAERYGEGGACAAEGNALSLDSGGSGQGGVAYATYRLTLGTEVPGAVTLDINLKQQPGSPEGSYWVGLGNYGRGCWEWRGPFTDGRARFSVTDGDYLSDLGNCFVCVVAHDGARLDIIGVGIEPADATDTTPPLAPSAPLLTPVAGGVLVEWMPVTDIDLAGYKVYWDAGAFPENPGMDVTNLGYLLPGARCLLTDVSAECHVRVSAVDFSGNESAASVEACAAPLAGSPLAMTVMVDKPTGLVGYSAALSATGGLSYHLDLDGSGLFEVTGDTTGTGNADTGQAGINRPCVMGINGDARALGAVSILVRENGTPSATAQASPWEGPAPLTVTFTGTASDEEDDLEDLVFAWDFDGDGTYEAGTDTLTPSPYVYTDPGTYEARFRVEDTCGSWAVDTVQIVATGTLNRPPEAVIAVGEGQESGNAPHVVDFYGSGSSDPDAGDSIEHYRWDIDGDGTYEATTDEPIYAYNYTEAGEYTAVLLVEDSHGATDTDSVEISVGDEVNIDPIAILTPNKTTSYSPFTINFDAAGSDDPDGSIDLYEWDFDGDGTYDDSTTVDTNSHTYPVHGFYQATLRVTDNRGGQDIATVDITLPTEWWMFGMGPMHTSLSPYNGPESDLITWAFPALDSIYGSPAIAENGTVYIGTWDGKLYALDPVDGNVSWYYTTGDKVLCCPAIGPDGTVYFGSCDDKLYALNPDGTFKWSYTTGDDVYSSPAVAIDGTVYFGGIDGKLYALNPDGSFKWSYTTGGAVYSSPAIGPDGRVYFGSADAKLYALNSAGEFQWSYTTGVCITGSPAIGSDGTVYIGSWDNKFYAINGNGTFKWEYETGAQVSSSPAIGADGRIYVGSYDKKLYVFNTDGSLAWDYTTGGSIFSSPLIDAGGRVYFGSSDNVFYALTGTGNLLWSHTTGDAIWSSPAIARDGTVYIGSYDNALYAFSRL